MNSDRNLLFGVLALQTDLIDSAQFADACAAWAARKTAALADILIERGWITAADKVDVERLMERKLKRHGGDLQATLDAVSDAGVREAMLTIEDTELRRTMARLPSASGHILVDPLAKPTESHTRYTLSRLHGQGGLGRVWVARDNDLNREVALKELQEECAESPVAKARFLKEAQITGQLEHPNIVPVYELGRRSEDQPFYTMRFLRGQTLRHAINAYHKKRKDGADDPLELRRLLGAFVGICHALAYAHSRGVVHRDVKPSNIALGDFGEVVLLDWGLAKIAHAEANMSETLALTDGASGGDTQAGRALGTPSYMAPEQAQGQLDLIGPATDIYGLGSTLFDLLTGKPPHKGETTAETLDRIIKGETPSARTVEPSVAPALDAVCAKAMAKSPSDRYAKASDLGDDIQRWLADEPVSCYPDPIPQRAARWARRHRTWTQSAAAALLVVTLTSAVATFLVDRARRSEASAKAQAEQSLIAETLAKDSAMLARAAESAARTEATRHLRDARAAIDTHLTEVSNVLRYFPDVLHVRQRLLEKAADDYERFAANRSGDTELQTEFGRATIRLGDVRRELGELDGALQAYRRATAIFDELCHADGAVPEQFLYRAASQTNVAMVLRDLNQNDEAEQSYLAALGELQSLVTGPHKTRETVLALAACLFDLSVLLHHTGRGDQAEEKLERALEYFEKLAGENTAENRFRFELANARLAKGQMTGRRGDAQKAVDLVRRAIEEFESLGDAEPDHPDYAEGRADARLALADMLRTLGRDAEQMESYNQAIADYESLMRAIPDAPRFRARRAMTRTNQGMLLHKLDLNPRAVEMLGLALDEFMDLIHVYPTVELQAATAATMAEFGQVQSDLDKNDEAEAALRSAVESYTALTTASADLQHRKGLASSLSQLARLMHKTKRYEEARETFAKAIAHMDELVRADADHPRYRDQLAWVLVRRGELLWDMNEIDEAKQAFRLAHELWEKVTNEFPEPEYLHHFAWLLTAVPDAEQRDIDRALVVATSAKERTPESAMYWNDIGVAHCRSKNWPAAIEALQQAEKRRLEGNSRDWFFLAIAHWENGSREIAQDYFAKATQWMDANVPGDRDLKAIRDEAAARLTQRQE